MAMQNIFLTGNPQTIADVLDNKDHRSAFQKKLLQQRPLLTLAAVKMNIPGPIKDNDYLQRLFQKGIDHFENEMDIATLKVVDSFVWSRQTGRENFYLLTSDAVELKELAIQFEGTHNLGRLFDIDILINKAGQVHSISRTELKKTVRQCLICSRPAKECARSRRHSIAELQHKISEIYAENFHD
ncbi:hypothetical protein OAL24_01193 [Oenococcus sicerae]|nr:hypothetical protein OAL24_01193 [Oenococcus sicerae]